MIWMQTLEGGAFDLLNPTPEMIDWCTVAIVLSRTSRFGGHTLLGPYSVAQHCVEGARAILRDTGRRDWAAAFLLHDVHEAFIGDIMTPVVEALVAIATERCNGVDGGWLVKAAIRELKYRIDCAVHEKAGLPFPLDPEAAGAVHEYDVRMAFTERSERLVKPPHPWHPSIESRTPIEGCDLTPWGEALAAALWTTAFLELVRPLEVAIPAPSCGCGAGCGDDVVTPWASDPSSPAPIDFQGWPDSPAPSHVDQNGRTNTDVAPSKGCDCKTSDTCPTCWPLGYRKESEDIWR